MALLGRGALAMWNDMAGEYDDEFNDWHSREHMPERVSVRGFLRGRRYRAIRGNPGYFTLYEVASLAVLTSPPYLARLDDPTPWTTRSLAYFSNMCRTACDVAASLGRGVGCAILTVQLAPAPGAAASLKARLADHLEDLTGRRGLVGAHLLLGIEAASRPKTKEAALRGAPDAVADWVLMVEGEDEDAVLAAADGPVAPRALESLGAAPGSVAAVYRLRHAVGAEDI